MKDKKVWDKPFEGCIKITKGKNKGKFTDKGFHDLSKKDDDRFREILSVETKREKK